MDLQGNLPPWRVKDDLKVIVVSIKDFCSLNNLDLLQLKVVFVPSGPLGITIFLTTRLYLALNKVGSLNIKTI